MTTLTIRDFFSRALAAAENRGYQRALDEFVAIANEVVAAPRKEPSSPAHHKAESDRREQPLTPNGGLLRPYEQRALTFIQANPGITSTQFREAGFKSASALYTLAKSGHLRKEGTRFYARP